MDYVRAELPQLSGQFPKRDCVCERADPTLHRNFMHFHSGTPATFIQLATRRTNGLNVKTLQSHESNLTLEKTPESLRRSCDNNNTWSHGRLTRRLAALSFFLAEGPINYRSYCATDLVELLDLHFGGRS